MSVGSQYVCFYVKLKLICSNLRIILHFQTGAAAAHTGGLCAAVMQPVAGGGYVALRRRHGRIAIAQNFGGRGELGARARRMKSYCAGSRTDGT